MVGSLNANIASALLGGGASGGIAGVDASLLTAWARAKAGVGVNTAAAQQDPSAPLAPVWTPGVSPSSGALIQRAFDQKSFFDTEAKLYSDLGATGDYKRLFALYSGLTTLQALAGNAENEKLSAADKAQTLAQFTRGLTELEAFFAQQQFEDIRLAQGDRVDAAQTSLALSQKTEDYLTGYIHRGGLYDKLAGLDADAQFTISATSAGGVARNVTIDFSQMGSITRSLGNVISFINGRLASAGVATRLEASDITPKENTTVVAGRTITSRYTGPKQFALKVDVRSNESVSFSAAAATPAFYALGNGANGARLIKLEDVGGQGGQPVWLERPASTGDPVGPNVAAGWLGAGFPYSSAPAGALEQRTGVLMSDGDGKFETALRAAGEAVLKLEAPDGRTFTVSTAWRSDDLEAWRTRDGESGDRAIMDDLAERLTQLLHEQGLSAGVDVWEDAGQLGFSLFSGDALRISGLSIGASNTSLETVEQPGMVGGLRDGVFARRFEVGAVAAASDVFIDTQTFLITTANTTHSITIDGGVDGVTAAALIEQLNDKLRDKGVSAAASFVDDGGALTLQFDALHDVIGVSATLNEVSHDTVLQAPGAWATGGLQDVSAGQPFADAIRSYTAAGSPLSTHTGALDIEIVVATATGPRTVSVSVSALERAANPDAAPGEWNAMFQDRLDAALNAAGVYVGATSNDLAQWSVAEGAGQRIQSLTINGDALSFSANDPAAASGGAFSAERSFTSGQAAAAGVADDVAALISDQTVSISFDTVWGQRAVSATLQPGDPRTLESAALRLNEALAAQGYDLGLVATPLSGGGAGLRAVTGASHTINGVSAINLGGAAQTMTLDPIDAISRADDPIGAQSVAERAARGAAVTMAIPADSEFVAPSANSSGWFPGRAFDVSVGGALQVATARSVATGADGSVYVLADLGGDSASSAIKGARDVALLKYDSAGKLAFTEILGASQSASGFALAVSSDGKVVVAGAVEGALSNTNAKGGADGFVTVFDASGKELWTARRGASGADQINAVAFAPNGSVIVAGQTESALAGQSALGGADGFVRGYSASGGELFTRQFGGGGADSASALMVRDNGAGGVEIVTGGVENNRGMLRSFSYSTTTGFSTGAARDIGYFHKGAINAIVADGSSLYVGGEIGADRLTLGATATGAVAGQEGFVARLDADLVSTGLDRATYLGSAQDDAVRSLAVVNGDVYAAGVTGGVMAGQGANGAKASFLTRLGDDGAADWTRTFNSVGGQIALSGLAVDQSGRSALDVLGLPRGAIAANDSAALVSRSALRAGDELKIGADGRRLTTIRIGERDTLATLVAQINRAIGGTGRAELIRENGVERIKITPQDGKAIRVEAGREGREALGGLGLNPGVIASNAQARGALKTYGLGLIAADLRLDSKTNIARAKAELSAAVSIVRQAYEAMLNPNAKELTEDEKKLAERRQNAGAAPEYYTARLANYQAALARLTGG
ncbi:MAG: hypothetical protein H7124_12995 [Phycisphaerales bacterium]|nr:hypothetical protein [Hyphomonadaceae bacterium]